MTNENNKQKETFADFLWREAEDGYVDMWNGKYSDAVKPGASALTPHAKFAEQKRAYVGRIADEQHRFNAAVQRINGSRDKRFQDNRDAAAAAEERKNHIRIRNYNIRRAFNLVWAPLLLAGSLAAGIFCIVLGASSEYASLRLPFVLIGVFVGIVFFSILSIVLIKSGKKGSIGRLIVCSAVSLCLVALAVSPLVAISVKDKQIFYSVYETYGVEVAELVRIPKSKALSGEVVLNEIDGYPIRHIGGGALDECDGITSLTIGDNVETVDYNALKGLTHLEKLDVAFFGYSATDFHRLESLLGEMFGTDPFENSYEMKPPEGIPDDSEYLDHYYLPETLTEISVRGVLNVDGSRSGVINPNTFKGARNVKTVRLGEGITEIGYSAFYASGVSEVFLPETLTSIGAAAFAYTDSLKTVALPETLTTIGDGAFSYATGLEEIVLPETLTTIGYNAFSNTPKLKTITFLGETCPAIYPSAFESGYPNPQIYVPENSLESFRSYFKRLFLSDFNPEFIGF